MEKQDKEIKNYFDMVIEILEKKKKVKIIKSNSRLAENQIKKIYR